MHEVETEEDFPQNMQETIEELKLKNSNLTNALDCLKKQMEKDKLLHYSFNYIVKLQRKDDANIVQSIEQEVNKYMALGQEDKTELDLSLRNLVYMDNSYDNQNLQTLSERSFKMKTSEIDATTCNDFKQGCANCESNEIYQKATFREILDDLMR